MGAAFSFGAPIWPGLAKLVEECGEVGQVAGKLMMTGGKSEHWDGSDLHQRLLEEMADVAAAIEFILTHSDLDTPAFHERMNAKTALFEKWHQEQRVRS